jgi:hypothetical protein
LLKDRVIVRIDIPQLRFSGVVHQDVREVSVKQAAGVMLSTFMLVNMRTWSLYERREQGQNHAESEWSEAHLAPILARSQMLSVQ